MRVFSTYFLTGVLGCCFFLPAGELFGRPLANPGNLAEPGAITLTVTVTNATCAYNNGIAVITASGGTAPYSFFCNAIQASNASGIFANLPPGTYSIQVTDAAGLTATAQASIGNTYTPPDFTPVMVNPSGCSKTDGSITLTGNGGLSPYEFSIDDGLSYQKSSVFPNLGMGLYHIFIRDANGCVTSPWSFLGGSYIDYQFYSIRPNSQVLLNPTCNLQLSAVPSGPVCGNNGFIEFYAAEGGTPPYTYSLDGVNFAPNTTHGYSSLAPGKYTIYVKDNAGLIITVVVDIPRDCAVEAIPAPTSCGHSDGRITVASANGIAPYIYSIDGVHFQNGNLFSGLSPGYYTVIAKDVNGATSSAYVEVSPGCLSVSALARDATCGANNGSITATPSGGPAPYRFSLDGINFQTGNSFAGLTPGPYTITVEDAHLGQASTTVDIGNKPGPVIGAGAAAATCVNNNGSITVTQQGGTSPFQYSAGGGSFQASGFFSGLDTGMRVVTVKDANGCLSSQFVDVPLSDDLSLDAGGNRTICEGTGVTLPATSNGTFFSWSPASGLSDTAALNPLASPDTSTPYRVIARNGLCLRTGQVTVFVDPAPVADPGADTIICFGKSVQLEGGGGLYYKWSPATYLDNAAVANPEVTRPATSIRYTLQVTDANGCRSLGTAAVQVTVTPLAKVFAGDDTTIVSNQPLRLHAVDVNGSGFTQYQWSPAVGLNDPFSQDPTVAVAASITYTVVASTPEGCQGADSITLKVFSYADIFVPNAFTPNGDGHNDIIKAIPAGIREFKYFAVFSRWGQQVFQTTNPEKGWDGTINGRLQSPGTYIWTALGIDYHGNIVQRKGLLILIR
jgi:gliding motility-associated-like protein